MPVEIYVPGFIKNLFNDKKIIRSGSGRLSNILKKLSLDYPSFKKEFFKPDGRIKEYVTLFVDDKIIDNKDLSNTFVKDNQKISIYVPLIGG